MGFSAGRYLYLHESAALSRLCVFKKAVNKYVPRSPGDFTERRSRGALRPLNPERRSACTLWKAAQRSEENPFNARGWGDTRNFPKQLSEQTARSQKRPSSRPLPAPAFPPSTPSGSLEISGRRADTQRPAERAPGHVAPTSQPHARVGAQTPARAQQRDQREGELGLAGGPAGRDGTCKWRPPPALRCARLAGSRRLVGSRSARPLCQLRGQ